MCLIWKILSLLLIIYSLVRACLSACLFTCVCLCIFCMSGCVCLCVRVSFLLLVCLYISLCVYIYLPVSTNLHLCVLLCLSVCLSVCLCVCLSVCLSACLSVCLFVLSVWLSKLKSAKLTPKFDSKKPLQNSTPKNHSKKNHSKKPLHSMAPLHSYTPLQVLAYAFPEFHSDLIWIRTLKTFFFFFKGERIQISLKAGHHRPASETPFNGVSLACRWWPNVEYWLGCSENFRGFDLVSLRGPDPLSPLWIRAWDRKMYTLIEIYWKSILSCASAFVRHFAYFLSRAQIFKLTKHSFLNSIRVWSGSKPFLQM